MTIFTWLKGEPAVLQGILVVVVALATHFGFNWSPELSAIVTAAFGFSSAQVVRAVVTPTSKLTQRAP